jgi:hypothetical protein
MRRALTLVSIAMALTVLSTLPPSTATDPARASVELARSNDDVESPVGQIIPKPNSGAAPQDAGDRGGALQLALLGLLVLFFAFAAWRVRLTVRRARQATTAST